MCRARQIGADRGQALIDAGEAGVDWSVTLNQLLEHTASADAPVDPTGAPQSGLTRSNWQFKIGRLTVRFFDGNDRRVSDRAWNEFTDRQEVPLKV